MIFPEYQTQEQAKSVVQEITNFPDPQ